jgi:hypothetical protein
MAKGIYKDLTGRQFGRLTVLEKSAKVAGRITWKCLCTCGKIAYTLTGNLTKGIVKSCGCLQREAASKVLLGEVFGELTVEEELEKRTKGGYKRWKARCSCGELYDVSSLSLLSGTARQCSKCSHAKLKRQFCVNGHDTYIWGRSSSQACRACIRDKHLRVNYGITLLEFIGLYNYQNGKCLICQKELGGYLPKQPGFDRAMRIEVDHDHRVKNKRESVRGLLCGGRFSGCNRKLGKIDNKEWLDSATKYIANPPAQIFLKGENAKIQPASAQADQKE